MILGSLGRVGDTVLRFVHEMTNVKDVRNGFHPLLAGVLDECKEGVRDPLDQQDILGFIMRFRALSLGWEERAGQGDNIRRFWNERLELERDTAKGKTGVETKSRKLAGKDPIEVEMVRVPAGSFLMGDEEDSPIHRVDITRAFMIGAVPVTQELYRAVTGEAPSPVEGNESPVENVSWFDAVRFCNELSFGLNLDPAYKIEGDSLEWDRESPGFRLPTEAEWEYSCRAGSTSRFACSDLESSLEGMAWYRKNSGDQTHSVSRKEPNAWGIFDMHGNVWEWVWDWYAQYSGVQASEPVGPKTGSSRVLRGGSWRSTARYCRSAYRGDYKPGYRASYLGFRLSRSVG